MLFSKTIPVAREQMKREIKRLRNVEEKPEMQERVQEVEELINQYVAVTSERPEPYALTGLADYLLYEVLVDQYKHARKDDYPIQSNKQASRKQGRHIEQFKTIESLEGNEHVE